MPKERYYAIQQQKNPTRRGYPTWFLVRKLPACPILYSWTVRGQASSQDATGDAGLMSASTQMACGMEIHEALNEAQLEMREQVKMSAAARTALLRELS